MVAVGREYSGPLAGLGRLQYLLRFTRTEQYNNGSGDDVVQGRVRPLCLYNVTPSPALGLMAIRPGVCTREGLGRFPGCG